ncbi:DUF445 family protein [Paenibacillus senegalensis]|uniref:DUF445 family protein n=1 Tax=Paenibacillus senegalensis TaxID=1465766 RepID=UPI00028988D4|nr:DUF445 family protein [Paenibacillus senegalensis]
MKDVVTVLIGITAAALIGGATNYLAIKMLFHPRQTRYFRGKRLPFTPGLIPKRKAEISKSLGKIVADYLVTSEGLNSLLRKPEFVLKIETKLVDQIERLSSSEDTLEQWALRFWTPGQLEQSKVRLAEWLREKSREGIRSYWIEGGWSERKIGEWLPAGNGEFKTRLIQQTSDMIILQLKAELETPEGDRLLRSITMQMLEQAGGLLGTLAGVFMDEDKLANKVKSALYRQLDSPSIKGTLSGFLERKLNQAEELTLGEIISFITGAEADVAIAAYADRLLMWEQWLDKAGQKTIGELLAPRKEWLQQKVPEETSRGLAFISSRMDKLVAVLELPIMVEEQVNKFPVERLENIILSVAGKELKAITWMGAALGGFIGLLQAMLMLWTR